MNMDFNKLRERAAAAATEATNIVSQFNELDAMAEEDEYLKTDDLNVTGQNKKEKRVEDLDEDHNGSGGGPAPVSAPNTATKQALADMMTPAAAAVAGPSTMPAPAPSATPATLTHQQTSMGYESANEFADGSETPALDSIFGQQPEQQQSAPPASGAAPPFASPEERAQQLIAQALFQTPMSSVAPSRATSAVGETSFLDYDSAREDDEDDNDIGAAPTDEKAAMGSNNATAAAAAETTENDTERENAVMDYLSKNSAGDSFSILDKVMSSSQSQTAAAKKPSAALADLDSALGNDLSTSADASKQPKREVNNSYMLSAVADLMSGKAVSAPPPPVTQSHQAEKIKWKEESSLHVSTANVPDHQNANTSDQPTNSQGVTTLDYDSDDSSSVESDWGGKGQQDPILSLMQKEGKLGGRSGSVTMITNVQPRQAEEAVTVIQGGVGGSLYDGQHGVQRKDPNRFISDIDRRAAPLDVEIGGGLGTTGAALNDIPQELLDGTPSKVDGHGLSHTQQQPFGDAGNKFQWFKQAAMGKVIQSVSKLEMALSPTVRNIVASRKDPRANNVNDQGRGTTEDEYSKVVSSSLLADEEHRELMRLKQNALDNQNVVTKIIDLVQSNPRFAFIAFTMVLLYFVSHWTRKRTEDDVTR